MDNISCWAGSILSAQHKLSNALQLLEKDKKGGGRGWGTSQVDLYHFSPLSHISLSFFSYPDSLNTLVNAMLEVLDNGDSTFSPSCVKVRTGCSLWSSVGHSDVWPMCSAVAWEGCKYFFNRRESLWLFAAARMQRTSCQEGCWCSCYPLRAGEWTGWPLKGLFWDEMIQHPHTNTSPSQLYLWLSEEVFGPQRQAVVHCTAHFFLSWSPA